MPPTLWSNYTFNFGLVSNEISNAKRARIHEYLSFRAAVKPDAGTAAAAQIDESKVRFARNTGVGRFLRFS
jgi:hypothetical protein